MKNTVLALAVIVLASFALPQKKITVFMAGDSTMSVKDPLAYPETGWGMPFVYFFDSTVKIDNRAKNGRSTRTFITEGRWEGIMKDLSPGDYVFIQFGHNDESKSKGERYTSPEDYKKNLTRFVNETRARRGKPVLLTPVSRRKFKDGKQVETHAVYADAVKAVADELNVPFIDINKISREYYQQMGEENSKLLFMQLQPGEHPNYPQGRNDNTHFNELGARKIAQLVLQEIRNLKLDLADRIIVNHLHDKK